MNGAIVPFFVSERFVAAVFFILFKIILDKTKNSFIFA
jgi:hypothetical protein